MFVFVGLGEAVATVDPRAIELLHETPEYRKCLPLLQDDPIIGDRAGKLVGSALSQSLLELERIPDWPPLRISRTGRDFDEDLIDTYVDELYTWLIRDAARYVVLAPLSGAVAATAIRLDPDVVIENLTDDEIAMCLNYRPNRRIWGRRTHDSPRDRCDQAH